jgi:PAS domain S-box-containing protein
VVKHSGELVNLATLDGKMIFLNEAGSKMLGIDPDEVEQANIMQVIPDHLKRLVTTELLPTLKDSRTWEGDLQYRNLKTGELTDVHAITFTVQDPLTSEPLYLANVSRDITERKRIEQDLAASYEKMRRAEQLASLGTLSATIAHELNQPLTVMRLFLQQGLRAHKDDNDGDKVVEVIDDCLSELTKAASIVDRFRRFARKSAPVYIAKVNLVEIANGIVEILAGTARREKLNLSVTVESCPPYIIGNSLELEQMFFVLIQNAIQAADGKTERELIVTISSQGDQLHLTFADTCCGIKEEDKDKIFEPFFTTKPANLGTGLGLCILERIVKRHGGSVRVESQIGRGTIFYICLPIKN